jgi:hypothetical protein
MGIKGLKAELENFQERFDGICDLEEKILVLSKRRTFWVSECKNFESQRNLLAERVDGLAKDEKNLQIDLTELESRKLELGQEVLGLTSAVEILEGKKRGLELECQSLRVTFDDQLTGHISSMKKEFCSRHEGTRMFQEEDGQCQYNSIPLSYQTAKTNFDNFSTKNTRDNSREFFLHKISELEKENSLLRASFSAQKTEKVYLQMRDFLLTEVYPQFLEQISTNPHHSNHGIFKLPRLTGKNCQNEVFSEAKIGDAHMNSEWDSTAKSRLWKS